MTPRPDCPRCKGTQFTHMPDSLAEACDNCGFVWVGGIAGMEWEPGATIGQWLEDVYQISNNLDAKLEGENQ